MTDTVTVTGPGQTVSVTVPGEPITITIHVPGPQGIRGLPGTDATVTAPAIATALGYAPATPTSVATALAAAQAAQATADEALASGGSVASVNGQTGAVTLDAADVGAEVPLTFGNGLTRAANAVKLGGALTEDTTVATGAHELVLDGKLRFKTPGVRPIMLGDAPDIAGWNDEPGIVGGYQGPASVYMGYVTAGEGGVGPTIGASNWRGTLANPAAPHVGDVIGSYITYTHDGIAGPASFLAPQWRQVIVAAAPSESRVPVDVVDYFGDGYDWNLTVTYSYNGTMVVGGVLTANNLSGTNTGDETPSGILAKLLTIDGASSGLDADTLDGLQAAAFALVSSIGAALGIAPLGADGKVSTAYLPASVLGQVEYQGLWNATGAAPTAGTGFYYIVSVAGTTNLSGITDWQVGDWAIYNGATWGKVDNTDAVSSVAGLTGIISAGSLKTALALVKADVGLGNADNTSDVNKPVSTLQATADAAVASAAAIDATNKANAAQAAAIAAAATDATTKANAVAALLPTTGQATIDFGAFPGNNEADLVITGLADILAGDKIVCSLSAQDSGTHTAADATYAAALIGLSAGSIVPNTGFTLSARSLEQLEGTFVVNYTYG